MEAAPVETPTVKRTLVDGVEIKRAILECMRNMGTISAYSVGASYLLHRHPAIFGEPLFAIILGGLMLIITVAGAVSAAEIFVDAVFQRHVDPKDPRWRKRHQVGLLIAATMLIFMGLAAVPMLIVFELPR